MNTIASRIKTLTGNKRGSKAAAAKQEREKGVDAIVYAQRVEKKAFDLYEKRGRQDGHDWDDWLEAERIVEGEMIAGK